MQNVKYPSKWKVSISSKKSYLVSVTINSTCEKAHLPASSPKPGIVTVCNSCIQK